jgi:phosphoribosyl 1,2-cyclic phosphodiesterase
METFESMNVEGYLFHELEAGKQVTAGEYRIIPFDVKHDVKCFGFLIHHEEAGTVLFATDTFYLRHTFAGLNNILIECNYRRDILDENTRSGKISAVQRNRVLQSHMSYDTCLETLLANDLSAVNNIVLIHLSDDNSNAEEFRSGIHAATGKTVHIARKGLNIEFNKTPF